jgi:protein TonB
MAVRKDPEIDLRLKQVKTFEIGMIVALALIIVAFRFFPYTAEKTQRAKYAPEIIKVEDIEHTRQENRPPPPPKPGIPIEAPSDEVLEDVTIGSTEIDITKEAPPPPPPKESQNDEAEYFVAVEDMPVLIGGLASIKPVYPELARRAGVEGRVFVLAFVDEQGRVTKAEVVKGIGAGCEEAAVAAIMKARFEPGKQRGKAVKVRIAIPVVFKLTNQ